MKLDGARITAYLPVAILVIFALLQIDRAYRHDQSPWMGGGFGMFSTNDRVSLRQVRYYALVDDREIAVRIDPKFVRAEKRIKSYPSEESMQRYARMLTTSEEGLAKLDGLRIEIWRTTFDSESATARMEKVRESTYRKAD